MQDLPKAALPPASYVPDLPRNKRRIRVVFAVGPYPVISEYAGPMEAFRAANLVLAESNKTKMGYDIEFVSSHIGTLCEMPGLKVTSDKSYKELTGHIDTLLFTPVDFNLLFAEDNGFLDWTAKKTKSVRRVVSICGGAYVLATAGLLNGKRATTHWTMAGDFRRRFPDVLFDPDPIYTKDGNIYTSAGLTAGIDLCLALIEEDFGRAVALRTAQAMVLFLKRPGGQAQFSTQLSYEIADDSNIVAAQSYIHEHIEGDLQIEKLAKLINMSSRNFSRAFTKEVGVSPGKYVEQYRLETARRHLEESSLPLQKVAAACGYRSIDTMHAAFERGLGLSPRAYRERFRSAIREVD